MRVLSVKKLLLLNTLFGQFKKFLEVFLKYWENLEDLEFLDKKYIIHTGPKILFSMYLHKCFTLLIIF